MCSSVTFIFAVRIQMAAHWDIKPSGTATHPKPRKNQDFDRGFLLLVSLQKTWICEP
ncbi:hypothetical protein [Hungatella sp.]|uniref:hypothetical protein n=1 Tax=Hungatella sp. TaxID=2613924 RepID=UPI0015F84512